MRRATQQTRVGSDLNQFYYGASRAPPVLKAKPVIKPRQQQQGFYSDSLISSHKASIRSYSLKVFIVILGFFICMLLFLGLMQTRHIVQMHPDQNMNYQNLRKENFIMPNPINLPMDETAQWVEPIVHIVNTRFMQSQGHLQTLGQARLYLFQTFCLPSILAQTTQNFLWIIKIDPNLDDKIRHDLISLIDASNRTNIYIVASDVNYLIGHDPGNWRSGEEREEIWSHVINGTVHTGDIERLWAAKVHAEDKIVLETRLDADDGLNIQYLETIQDLAMEKFGPLAEDEIVARWFYWCIERHGKWYLGMDSRSDDFTDDYGFVTLAVKKNYCITPGLTVGWNFKRISQGLNDIVSEEPPTNYSHADLYHHMLDTHKGQCGLDLCIESIKEPFIAAFRTRTFTSAGMMDIDFESKGTSDQVRILWETLTKKFKVSRTNIAETKQYFLENAVQIARENLEGQCTKGN